MRELDLSNRMEAGNSTGSFEFFIFEVVRFGAEWQREEEKGLLEIHL